MSIFGDTFPVFPVPTCGTEKTPKAIRQRDYEERAGWRQIPGNMTHAGNRIMGEVAQRYQMDSEKFFLRDTIEQDPSISKRSNTKLYPALGNLRIDQKTIPPGDA